MKLRRSRTLSSRPRSFELDTSETDIFGSWHVEVSFPKLLLKRTPEQQRKRERRSNVSFGEVEKWNVGNFDLMTIIM